MSNLMFDYVLKNKFWVELYDNTEEIFQLKKLFKTLKINNESKLKIADIGCGSGRSVKTLLTVFPDNSEIIAIDKNMQSIICANNSIKKDNVVFNHLNAFSFFSDPKNKNAFDIIYFSWSFFDMPNETDILKKENQLYELLILTKSCLKKNGCIVVLQPTKGGTFEKLLSKFMPNSDADYELVHNFLINNHFIGAKSSFPGLKDEWTIWSNFEYTNINDVYLGVASVLYLEQSRVLTMEHFRYVFNEFLKELDLRKDKMILSDCVNLYYLCE